MRVLLNKKINLFIVDLSPMEAAAYEKAKEDKNSTDYADKNVDTMDTAGKTIIIN